MTNSKSKGDRRERQAESILNSAGYLVERPFDIKFGDRTDFFGEFDILAVHPDRKPAFIQVRSNRASGINNWVKRVKNKIPLGHVDVQFWVCHDREGWRILEVDEDGYTVIFDERDKNVNMGEGVKEFISQA